jgi:hypothetical protein
MGSGQDVHLDFQAVTGTKDRTAVELIRLTLRGAYPDPVGIAPVGLDPEEQGIGFPERESIS